MNTRMQLIPVLLSLALSLAQNPALASAPTPKDATAYTRAANREVLQELPFNNQQDFEDARRGFIADLPDPVIRGAQGNVVIDLSQYDFLKKTGPAPDTVNPSLWRQSQLLAIRGLFKVVDGIYQVRNIDMANITFVRGKTGWIVLDPLTSTETAKAALELINDKVERLPVSGVIFTHSHLDHFAGIRALVSDQDVRSGKIPVVAPDGFMEEAVSENIYAGTAMSRRASFMYGNLLPKNPRGNVGAGLGLTTASGTISLIAPNILITKTGEQRTIDGVQVVFQMAPGSEAPSEMLFYFPQFHALDLAEDANHTMHNILTLRGAKVRSALDWSKHLNETLNLWGKDVQVSFGGHHWPQWGNARVVTHLEKQRDLYKYINDQTLRLINQGFTMHEIADQLSLPKSLSSEFYNRGYYGVFKHNVRATYQLYLGWWDANPADFDPFPPTEEARRLVALIGADKMRRAAQTAFDQGDYRWSAQLTNKLVFADPKNRAARYLEADALEQLGYQSESGTMRNFYLSGAQDLRQGMHKAEAPNTTAPDIIRSMTTPMFFDFLAIHLNGPKAADKNLAFNFTFPDTKEQYLVTVSNGVLNYQQGQQSKQADASLTMDRSTLDDIALGKLKLSELANSGKVALTGDRAKFNEFVACFEHFNFWFTISEP